MVYILLLFGIIYYIIFHKHHKRNKVELFELITLVTKFYVLTTISCLIIALGIYCFYVASLAVETRADVISYIVLGIIIISLTIINYIFYIKLNLRDYNQEIRAENNKKRLKIGEVLEFICFIICILSPIFAIPSFIEVFGDKREMIFRILKSFGICIFGLVLMFQLNPLNIKRFLVEEKNEEPIKKKRGRPRKNLKNSKLDKK